jgi:hypothetical protein
LTLPKFKGLLLVHDRNVQLDRRRFDHLGEECRVTLLHAIYSFLFASAIIGFVVNVISNIT